MAAVFYKDGYGYLRVVLRGICDKPCMVLMLLGKMFPLYRPSDNLCSARLSPDAYNIRARPAARAPALIYDSEKGLFYELEIVRINVNSSLKLRCFTR